MKQNNMREKILFSILFSILAIESIAKLLPYGKAVKGNVAKKLSGGKKYDSDVSGN